MAWLPRVHLSALDDAQVRELVTRWLDNDGEKISVFFDQLEKSRSLAEMMIVPLLATLIVLVFKQTGKLPENKARLYEIFVDLHNGGWDLAKGLQRPSHFSAAIKMFVLKYIAASIHKARRREIVESDAATVVHQNLGEVDWDKLRRELLQDGLIIQQGAMISFAHHSFQEFLTARHLLGNLKPQELDTYCDEYLKGSDWWQEVLCFYIDLSGKPREIRAWLDERLQAACKFSERRPTAEKAVSFLTQHLERSFPFAK